MSNSNPIQATGSQNADSLGSFAAPQPAAAKASTEHRYAEFDWCVVYRTGGTDNFQWHRSLAMTHEAALLSREAIIRGGRPAMAFRYSLSVSIGLPDTYEYKP